MIPRFSYSFSIGEFWDSLKSLIPRETTSTDCFREFFPSAAVYEISSARLGIQYALQAFQLKQKARIGIQPYTCSSVMAAITAAGFRPVFIDITNELTLDCDDLEKKVNSLDALIVTHTFGIAADIDQIKKKAGHLPIIEDCAHAFLSRYKGIPVGRFFDIAVFSFGYGKFPTLGHGGLLVVNNKTYQCHIAEKINQLKPPTTWAELAFIGRRLTHSLIYSRIGYRTLHVVLGQYIANKNKRIQSSAFIEIQPFKSVQLMLRKKWKFFTTWSLAQQQNALLIHNSVSSLSKSIYIINKPGNWLGVVLYCEDRDHLYRYLIQQGIGAGKHFQYAMAWATTFGYVNGSCPMFEKIVTQILTIPCNHRLRKKDLHKIKHALAIYIPELFYEKEENTD
ncbi:DegT/DnrJ/EryC1/StrS family aminotransferase [Larkinella bovis]|uniref:DegT/DnrJ/EryC1/StrS family aminotransferase n=1 Tax=Larkinella bovis TaxID=683041 RepID=A0ABW0IKW0_9BACT